MYINPINIDVTIVDHLGLTDIGKYSVGRLRPHFIDGCKPEGPGLDLINCKVGEYITNFTCTTTNKKVFADLRLSFPSGHASMSAMAMIFLAVSSEEYVDRKLRPFQTFRNRENIYILLRFYLFMFMCLSEMPHAGVKFVCYYHQT